MAWYSKQEGGMTNFQSPEYDRLRKELQSTLDRKKRVPLARKIQELALDECFTVIVAPDPRPWAYAPYVKGFTYDSENTRIIHGVWFGK